MQDLVQAKKMTSNEVSSSDGVGLAGNGVTAKHYGDGRNWVTVLTFSGLTVGTVAAAAKAIGVLVFTLPAGAQVIEQVYHSVAFDNADGSCDADDPVVGIGSVI